MPHGHGVFGLLVTSSSLNCRVVKVTKCQYSITREEENQNVQANGQKTDVHACFLRAVH